MSSPPTDRELSAANGLSAHGLSAVFYPVCEYLDYCHIPGYRSLPTVIAEACCDRTERERRLTKETYSLRPVA